MHFWNEKLNLLHFDLKSALLRQRTVTVINLAGNGPVWWDCSDSIVS